MGHLIHNVRAEQHNAVAGQLLAQRGDQPAVLVVADRAARARSVDDHRDGGGRGSGRGDVGEPAHGVHECVGQIHPQHRSQFAPVERHQDQGLLGNEAEDGRQRSDEGSGPIQREFRLLGCHGSNVDDHPVIGGSRSPARPPGWG